MPQMPVTARTADFDTVHAVAMIVNFGHSVGSDRRCKARPARTAVKFVGRLKQQRSASTAMKCTIAFLNIQRAAKRPFGAGFTQDMILHWRKAGTPFLLVKVDLFHLANVGAQRPRVKLRAFTNNSPCGARIGQ